MASPVDTSAKFFNENLPDAPVLNGVAGSLIGLLTACLVTGFGLRTAVSLVVSGGVATLTLADEAKNANRFTSDTAARRPKPVTRQAVSRPISEPATPLSTGAAAT